MKKTVALCIALIMILTAFSACGKKQDGTAAATNADGSPAAAPTTASNGDNAADIDTELRDSAYVSPSEAVTVDTGNGEQNPSNENISFVFDEVDGKLVKYTYKANGGEILMVYKYREDNTVEIYGFSGDTLVANEIIQLPGDFDPTYGLRTYKGYYFYGYDFK